MASTPTPVLAWYTRVCYQDTFLDRAILETMSIYCVAIVNISKTIWPYNLSPLITRETPFPGFLYEVSICLVMVF